MSLCLPQNVLGGGGAQELAFPTGPVDAGEAFGTRPGVSRDSLFSDFIHT